MTNPAEDLFIALDELALAQREAAATMARRLDWPRASLAVIRKLSACGTVQLSDVAARLRVDVSVASRQVSQLVDAGLVRRTVDSGDRRARLLELTEDGHTLCEQMTAQYTDLLGSMFADWTSSDITDAAHQIRRVAGVLTTNHLAHAVTNEEGTH